MLDFHKKKLYRKIFFSRITAVVLLIALLFVGKAIWNVYKKEREARENLRGAQARLEELERREEFLSSEIEELSTEEGIEREVREKFGVVKEGEKVIIIVDSEAGAEGATRSNEDSFWRRIFSVFKGD